MTHKAFIGAFVANILIGCLSFVHAEAAFADPPPGNADATQDGMLMERWIIQTKGPIPDPKKLPIFREVAPIIENAKRLVPEFGRALETALNKNWSFGYEGIQNCPTEYTWYSDDGYKVACQYPDKERGVVINPDWFSPALKKPRHRGDLSISAQILKYRQRQKDLFMHELFLGLTLGKGVNEEGMAMVLEALTKPRPKREELEYLLEHYGFMRFDASLGSHCRDQASNQPAISAIEQQQAAVMPVVSQAVGRRASAAEIVARDNYIAGLYKRLLGRNGDPQGLTLWKKLARYPVGWSCAQFAADFLASREYRKNAAKMSNGEYVKSLYKGVLWRSPTRDEFDHFLGLLDSGRLSRNATALEVMKMVEFDADCYEHGFEGAGQVILRDTIPEQSSNGPSGP